MIAFLIISSIFVVKCYFNFILIKLSKLQNYEDYI